MTGRKRVNIMTSCDDNLTNYIFVQLKTIAKNLKDKNVYFYLFHNKVPSEKLQKLKVYSEFLGNITFQSVFVEDIEPYNELAKNGIVLNSNSEIEKIRWPGECYFAFGCQKYLPEEVDRILYIDAGDVIFMGEIDDYYFTEFDGNSLIITQRQFKSDNTMFTIDDLNDLQNEIKIKTGILNSGSYIINVDMLRADDLGVEKIVDIVRNLKGCCVENLKYCTDEGLLSYIFLGKIKNYSFEDEHKRLYRPYNFTLDFFPKNLELWYKPSIVHFAGGGVTFKPWYVQKMLFTTGIIPIGKPVTSNEIVRIAIETKVSSFIYGLEEKECSDMTIIGEGEGKFYEYWFETEEEVLNDFRYISGK